MRVGAASDPDTVGVVLHDAPDVMEADGLVAGDGQGPHAGLRAAALVAESKDVTEFMACVSSTLTATVEERTLVGVVDDLLGIAPPLVVLTPIT